MTRDRLGMALFAIAVAAGFVVLPDITTRAVFAAVVATLLIVEWSA